MKTYFDTGVLLKIYIQEINSLAAIALVSGVVPVPFTHLHSIELPTAIRLKRFRDEITANEERAALLLLKGDIRSGRLQMPTYALTEVFYRAESLSVKYASAIGTRSLDLLHVAAAIETGCTVFVSFDERQRQAAKREGLKLLPAR